MPTVYDETVGAWIDVPDADAGPPEPGGVELPDELLMRGMPEEGAEPGWIQHPQPQQAAAGPGMGPGTADLGALGMAPAHQGEYRMLPGSGPSPAAVRALREAEARAGALEDTQTLIAGGRTEQLGEHAQGLSAIDAQRQAIVDRAMRQRQLDEDRYESRREEVARAIENAQIDYQHARERAAGTTIDPKRYWRNQSEAAKVMGWIGTVLGALTAPSMGGRNLAMENIAAAVNRDIELQKHEVERQDADLERGANLVRDLSRQGLAVEEARRVAADIMWQGVQHQVAALAQQSESEVQRAKLDELSGQIAQERMKEQSALQQQVVERARRAARGTGPSFAMRLGSQWVPLTRREMAQHAMHMERTITQMQGQAQSAQLRDQAAYYGVTDSRRTQAIANRMERQQVPRMQTALARLAGALNGVIERARRDGADIDPAMGPGEALVELVMGDPEGQIFNTALADAEGEEFRNALANVAAIRTFAMSGKQTNEQEVRRLTRALYGDLQTPSALLGGLAMVSDEFANQMAQNRGSDLLAYNRFLRDSGFAGPGGEDLLMGTAVELRQAASRAADAYTRRHPGENSQLESLAAGMGREMASRDHQSLPDWHPSTFSEME